jgi:DNA-binding transcriptional MerR regulator
MPTDADTPTYTLADLSRLADVTPRTVRYYVAQGLLPSPATLGPGSGPGSRYGEAHLDRLRLIRRLQRRHLPLAEIRTRLAGLSHSEVTAALGEPDGGAVAATETASALDYIRRVLAPKDGMQPHPSYRVHQVRAINAMAAPQAAPGQEPTRPRTPMAPGPTATPPDRSQWERIGLTPDVELHVRRPLGRLLTKRVDRLVTIARELLEEEQP